MKEKERNIADCSSWDAAKAAVRDYVHTGVKSDDDSDGCGGSRLS